MITLIEITGDDISALTDADLRELIGLLCEADYRSAGLPTKGITWGGNQDAKDGGLDVVVRDEASPPAQSDIPRKATGFQVKKPDMPRSEILKEMRPADKLRECIKTLIDEGGAYIIVSSTGSTTETALSNRRNAMKEAVADHRDHTKLYLDFYDRGRIATWVRSYPNLVLWVRNKIGKPLVGWRPYENWSNAPGGVEEEYLLDDGLRLHDGARPTDDGFSAEDGFAKLRSALATPGASVRLAGLSGVGKTRFVQALFDDRIGTQALETNQAIYTDVADSPSPDPATLANQLINDKTRTILIVDNCPPDLHHRLTQACSGPHSTVSLLTIEYDVRDDLPEETSVYRLEPASEEIIEKLIKQRFVHIGDVDARTIASFSGGNARVAIALANTVQQGETVSGFRNEQLFERLFWQRHSADQSLLASAQVCSLVYSFQGEDADSDESELKFLASFIGKSGADLYHDVAELKARDLVQSRSVWRAVLPHAVANRLAIGALKSIPKNTIVDGFLNSSERIITSFTRRLNFLHDCNEAVDIVDDWLKPEGWLGTHIGNLSSFGMTVLRNVAPVSPEKTLEAIERVANGEDGKAFTSREATHFTEFVRLLRHLAYDPALFERSVELLCRYALQEARDERYNSIRDVLRSLFYIYLSGTHAPIEMRAKVINALVNSEDEGEQELGLYLLDAALETWHFSASHEFEFGARPRDYGYHPNTREEIQNWFNTALAISERLALSERSISIQSRKMLAHNLRGLWTKGGLYDAIKETARKIHEHQPWNDGWIAVRGIITFDAKRLNEDVRKRLLALEQLLKPNELLEKARTFALSAQHRAFDLADAFDDEEDPSAGYDRVEEKTREIGTEVAQNPEVLSALIKDILSTSSQRLYSFGIGLAQGCSNKSDLFQTLYDALEKISVEKREINVLRGFLASCAESDPEFYSETLDRLVSDDLLGEWFPVLQTTSAIDRRGLERLLEALEQGKAKIHLFQFLAYGRAHETISDDDLASLLNRMLSREGGIEVVLKILHMRFHGRKEEETPYSRALNQVARDALSTYVFEGTRRMHGNDDYELAKVARVCLVGPESIDAASNVCQHLAKAIGTHSVYAFDYSQLLNSLARVQPQIFLDVFLAGEIVEDYQRHRMFSDDFERRENPLRQIPDDELISWCEGDPELRYPVITTVISGFEKSKDTEKYGWNSIVGVILAKAPDMSKVLDNLADSLRPRSWSGSRADILQRRSALLQELQDHKNDEVAAWAKYQSSILREEIAREREWESRENRERNESFE